MAFDKGSLLQDRLDILVEDLSGQETSLLDAAFPRVETDRHKYVVDIMPASILPTQKGKLADGAPSQPRHAHLDSVAGKITGRYEGSYAFSEAERRELENTNVGLERYARAAQAIASYNIDVDLKAVLEDTNFFPTTPVKGTSDFTDPEADLVGTIHEATKKLGRREDLIVILGKDVADNIRRNHDILARLSNFAAGYTSDDELQAAFRGLGFRNLYVAGSYGKDEPDGISPFGLNYTFDGLFWIGRPDAVLNVELGRAGGEINYLPQTKEWLLDYFRFIDIKAPLESGFGGTRIQAPLG